MVLEEAPGKVCEAFRLFLQGMGYGVYYNIYCCLEKVKRYYDKKCAALCNVFSLCRQF